MVRTLFSWAKSKKWTNTGPAAVRTGIDCGASPIQAICFGRSGAAMVSRSGRTPGRYPEPPAPANLGGTQVSNDVWQRIEQARARWNVLEHPFYQRWSAGDLTREELADYSGQYRH